jgi:hypothetical protein
MLEAPKNPLPSDPQVDPARLNQRIAQRELEIMDLDMSSAIER